MSRTPHGTPSSAAEAQEGARRALAAFGPEARARLLASLARRFGDLGLTEDSLQDAFVQALRTWPETGVPAAPAAWLMTTARRRALDAVRREGVLAQKLAQLRIEEERAPLTSSSADPAEAALSSSAGPLADDRLVLFFTCAHPALRPEDRIALTLRFVAGLTTEEVAHALLVPTTTMQQRIVRAKKRIRTLGIPFTTPPPAEIRPRLHGVLRVVYLLYAEGFARSTGDTHVRDDLTADAIRLACVLHRSLPAAGEVTGLLGLLLLTEARRPARISADGVPIPLARQDRERWDAALIAEGITCAEVAAASAEAGTYAIQAAIAAVHAEAPSAEATDWRQIAVLYRMLEAHEPGPVVRLGRAVALGRAHGAEEGLRRLDALASDPVLARFRPFHIARAITLEELGDAEAAARAYRHALSLGGNDAEDEFLTAALD